MNQPAPATPKVLLLIKSLGLGGAERLLVDSLPYLDRARFDYYLAYLLPWKDALVGEFVGAGVPVECLGKAERRMQNAERNPEPGTWSRRPPVGNLQPGAKGPLWATFDLQSSISSPHSLRAAALMPLALARLVRMCRREGIDLIHADMPAAGVLARIAGRRLRIPVLYTEHNLQERYHPLTRRANALTYGWNSHVLAVSDEVAASIGRGGLAAKAPVTTLLNGVPAEAVRAEAADGAGLREELGIPPGDLVVGAVAVFRAQKRLADWLAAAAAVAASREDVTFLLVGDGPEMPAVRAGVAALGLGERVRLPGFRADGRRLMGLMDVYLMSSEFEGLPIALLEAMALGIPVVATAVGGIPEAVTHGREGFLAAAGDVQALAAAVLRLLADPNLRRTMGGHGAARVDADFHIRRRVAAIEALYARLLVQ